MTKHSPCCARLYGQLYHEQNNLKNLARKAALADQKGHDLTKFRELLARARSAIAEIKVRIEEHEAEHAGEAA